MSDDRQYIRLLLPDGKERWMTRADYEKLYQATMWVFNSAMHFRELPDGAELVEFAEWRRELRS